MRYQELENKVADSIAQYYDGLVNSRLEELRPIPAKLSPDRGGTIKELSNFISTRNNDFLTNETFSIKHYDCDIENEYDGLLPYIARKAFDIERQRIVDSPGAKYRVFMPSVSITKNQHKYGRSYLLNIKEVWMADARSARIANQAVRREFRLKKGRLKDDLCKTSLRPVQLDTYK